MIASLRSDLVGLDPSDFPNPWEHLAGHRLDSTGFPLDVREVSPSGSFGEPSRWSREKGDLFWETFLRVAVDDVRKRLT